MECIADDVLTSVSIDVLEKHAFLFPEREEGTPPSPCVPDPMLARVRFSGSVSGEFVMCIPSELAGSIAADILGTDPGSEDAAALVADSVGELANVLCGNVLKASQYKEQIFDLAAPEVSAATEEIWKNLSSDSQTIELSSDEHRLLVHLRFRNDPFSKDS